MNEHKFTQLLGGIDPALIARAEQSVPMRKKPSFRRALIAAVAAVLAMATLLGVAAIAMVPKTYDLDYSIPDNQIANTAVRVYYTDENGKVHSERVRMPDDYENVFITWQHLCGIGDEVEILSYDVLEDPVVSIPSTPNTLWDFLLREFAPAKMDKTVTVTLSAQITSYNNYDALIESLTETIAKYAGVDVGQVNILIDGEQIAIVGGLQFWHSLQGGGPVMIPVGSELDITVGMTNVSDKDIEFTGSWTAFVPSAILTMGNTSLIVHEEYQMTNEYAEYRLAPGESREITYTFPIPENATCGEYDLLVTFGEQDFVFEKAVQVVGFGYVPGVTGTEFHEFLIKYGFVTVDVSEFRSAVAQLTYHSGKGLFDIMTMVPSDYAEGYSGEEYGSDLFAYGYLTEPNGSCNNYFVGLVLPDDMRLPHGIARGDRLFDSLCKMGLDADAAQDAVEKAQALSEGEQLMLGNEFFNFYITRNEYGEYVILYSFIAAPVVKGAGPPEYSLEIIYSEANMTFQCFQVKAGYEKFSTDAFTAPITVAPIWQSSVGRELNEEDTQKLIAILNGGTWKKGSVDVVCDYQITSANKVYSYSTSAGVFMSSDHYLSLSEENRRIVNEMVTVGNYQPNFSNITLYENNLLAPLPDLVALQIKNALNNAEWRDGSIELEPLLWFDCDGQRVGYDNGLFLTTQHYWYADNYTEDCINALQDAIVGLRTNEYNAIIYYAGTYYGHSEAVDEKLNGTVSFSMNINPQPLDDILYAHDDKQAVSAFGDIVDCKNAVDLGILVTVNGAYFERITEIKPDLSKGEVKLIRTPAGEPPIGELTEEDAQMLRDIFQRAEFTYCFEDHDAEYETILEIGSYTIAYLSAWGDARIGDLKATLSEQDTQTVAEIIGGYINVE